MNQQTHYEILDVVQTATNADLKNAYRRLVKKYHPDISKEPDAVIRIRHINVAYEVLSDYYSRISYDASLLDGYIPYEPTKETEDEKYRREYLKKKVHEERVRMENLFRTKVRFYKFQRMVCYFFFASAIIFSIDYFISNESVNLRIDEIHRSYGKATVKTSAGEVQTNIGLLDEYNSRGGSNVTVSFSLIFKIPSKIRLEGSTTSHFISGTLHSFRNIFSILTLIFSAIVIQNKQYSDFRLTCGIVPGFLVPFMYMMTLPGYNPF